MRYDEITLYGPLYLEKLASLPTWTSDDQKRLVLIDGGTSYSLYMGDATEWKQVTLPPLTVSTTDATAITAAIAGNPTGQAMFLAWDGTSYYLVDPLPNQTGHDGHVLKTNGTIADWVELASDDVLPNQTGQKARFLQTDGTRAKWSLTPSELPAKAGNAGKILTVDSAETTGLKWNDVDSAIGLPAKTAHALEFLQVNSDEDAVLWNTPFPTYTGSGDKYLKDDGTTKAWDTLNLVPDPSVYSVLTTDGSTISWSSTLILPDQNNNDGKVLATNGTNPVWTDISSSLWITEDTTWIIPTTYATLALAFAALENYYIHPNATLTISLLNGTHNMASGITVTNRGVGEGYVKVVGASTAGTIITSNDFTAFNTNESFFDLQLSTMWFDTLTMTGSTSKVINGVSGYLGSTFYIEDCDIENFGGYGAMYSGHSRGRLISSTFSGSNINVAVWGKSYASLESSTVSNGTYGVFLNQSAVRTSGSNISGNVIGVMASSMSDFRSYNTYIRLSDTYGIHATNKSNIVLLDNPGSGIEASYILNNATGILVEKMSSVDAELCTFTGNTLDVKADQMSYARVKDATGTLYSPAVNTTGNVNSIISNA